MLISIFSWQKYKIEEYLDGKLKETLIASFDNRVLFDNVSIRFNSIILNDVRIVAGEHVPSIHIGQIQFGFNPLNYLTNNFDVLSGVSYIKLNDGSITFRSDNLGPDFNTSQDSIYVEYPGQMIRDIWIKYGNNQKIELENFNINVDLKEWGIKPIVRTLDGYLNVKSEQLQLVLSGNLLYSEKQNSLLLCNITKDSLSVELKWDKINLAENWPFQHFSEIVNPDGSFSGDFFYRAALRRLDDYKLQGKSALSGLEFDLNNNLFRSGNLSIETDKSSNLLLQADVIFEKNKINLEGRINPRDIESGYFRIKSDLDNFEFINRLSGIPIEARRGSISLETKKLADGFPWKGHISLLSPHIGPVGGDSVSVSLTGNWQEILLKKMVLYNNHSRFESHGGYAFTSGSGELSGKWVGSLPPKVGFLDIEEHKFTINYGLKVSHSKFKSGYVTGEFNDSKFRFIDAKIKTDRDHQYFLFQGDSLSQFTGEMVVWDSILKGRQIRADLSLPGNIFRQLGAGSDFIPAHILMNFDGDIKSFSSALKVQFSKKLSVDISGDYDRKKRSEKFLGMVGLNVDNTVLEGPIDWSKEGNNYHGTIDINDAINLIISGNEKSKNFSGKLDIISLPMSTLFSPWFGRLDGGELSSEIDIQNFNNSLSAKGHLSAKKMMLYNIGYYDTDINFSFDNRRLSVKNFDVFLNNNKVLQTTGDYSPDDGLYDFSLSGKNLDLEYISQTLLGKGFQASGKADCDIVLINNEKGHPSMTVDFHASNGDLEKIPFDQVDMNATAVDTGTGWQASVEKFNWFHQGDINLKVAGLLPLARESLFNLKLDFEGDILKYLPNVDHFFTHGSSKSKVTLNIIGKLSKPSILTGELTLVDGSLGMADVIDEIENIRLVVNKDKGGNYVEIKELSGTIDKTDIKIHAVKSAPESGRPLKTWYFKDFNLDFGILILETTDRGVPLKIFGPMGENEYGNMQLTGREAGEKFYFAGPIDAPVARGKALIKNASVTYPFLTRGGNSKPSPAVLFLKTVDWNILAIPEKNVHYVNNVKALVDDIVIDMTANPEESSLEFNGRLVDKTFKVDGQVVSNSGKLEYLDFDFRVEQFGVNFNSTMGQPEVYGAAYTTIRDTVGGEDFPRDIYLRLYSVDPLSGEEKIGGAWSELHFKLETDNLGVGETESDILSYLGYSPNKIKNKATSVGGAVADKLIFRPIVKPLEQNLESLLGLDVVRVNAVFTKNIFSNSLNNQLDFSNQGSDIYRGRLQGLAMFSQSKLTLGKYLYPNLYFSYTGRLVSLYDASSSLGFTHQFGLEYRLYRNLLFEVEYDLNRYDYRNFGDPVGRPDFRFRVRQSIHF